MKKFEIECYEKLLNALLNYFMLFSGQKIWKIFNIQPNRENIEKEVSSIEKIIEEFRNEKYESNEMIKFCGLIKKVIKLDYIYILDSIDIFNVINHLYNLKDHMYDTQEPNINKSNELLNIMLCGIEKVEIKFIEKDDIVIIHNLPKIIKKITQKRLYIGNTIYIEKEGLFNDLIRFKGHTNCLFFLDIFHPYPIHI